MARSRDLQLDRRKPARLSAPLGLLLVFGLSFWVGVIPRSVSSLVSPLLADQAKQLVITGSGDELRVRPTIRKGNWLTDSDPGTDQLYGVCVKVTAVILQNHSSSLFLAFTTIPFSKLNRYQLPSPRAPPVV